MVTREERLLLFRQSVASDSFSTLWTVAHQKGGGDKLGIWGYQIHTTIYKIDKQQGPTVQHRQLFKYLVISYNGKESEKIYIHITESLCYTSETLCYTFETLCYESEKNTYIQRTESLCYTSETL